ncbi:MAG TPA: AzlC family ABC transporter permease [Acidimicrobiales bacterium]|nr:AzlC family ABC transporter permease [Acidimicrobiales bacterium]
MGVIPFGLVAGATPSARGLGGGAAIGFSTIVFAGASQLAAIDVLGDGGSAIVAVLAACTINLRMLLYSASLAPHLAGVPLRRRLTAAYLLTDQAYALSISRWTASDRPPLDAADRVAYYFGTAVPLWVGWNLATIAGVLVGAALPESLPLDFAVPMVFLVLLVPAVTSWPAVAAVVAGGGAAVVAAELGFGGVAILAGAVCGIAAGVVGELVAER